MQSHKRLWEVTKTPIQSYSNLHLLVTFPLQSKTFQKRPCSCINFDDLVGPSAQKRATEGWKWRWWKMRNSLGFRFAHWLPGLGSFYQSESVGSRKGVKHFPLFITKKTSTRRLMMITVGAEAQNLADRTASCSPKWDSKLNLISR